MKITLTDGTVIQRKLPGALVGYRAAAIEIDANDVEAIAAMALRDPGAFQIAMKQLAARFSAAEPSFEEM